MAVYFFHLRNGEDRILDQEGIELPDLGAVRDRALHEARAIVAADAAGGHIDLTQSIEVETADGVPVLRLPLADAVTIRGARP